MKCVKDRLTVDLESKFAAHSNIRNEQRVFFNIFNNDIIPFAERQVFDIGKFDVGLLFLYVQFKVLILEFETFVSDNTNLHLFFEFIKLVCVSVEVLEVLRVQFKFGAH